MPRPEIAALNTFRLEHDWTFDQLAAEMARAKCPIPSRTLHYLIKRSPRDARPLDRTLFKIVKFLKGQKVQPVAESRRRRRAVKPADEVTV
jgi:hypothetical protein